MIRTNTAFNLKDIVSAISKELQEAPDKPAQELQIIQFLILEHSAPLAFAYELIRLSKSS